MSLFDEEFAELAVAVFAGDLARAEAALDAMHAAGCRSEAIQQAKRIARPDLRAEIPPLAAPIPLPQPGRMPADVFGPGGNPPPQGRRRW